jgi:hypothetical protein
LYRNENGWGGTSIKTRIETNLISRAGAGNILKSLPGSNHGKKEQARTPKAKSCFDESNWLEWIYKQNESGQGLKSRY